MNELINKDNEWIIHFMGSLDRRLKMSRRTLQDYRNEGRIAYIQLGGKILYRESDIERMLADGYRSAYRLTGT